MEESHLTKYLVKRLGQEMCFYFFGNSNTTTNQTMPQLCCGLRRTLGNSFLSSHGNSWQKVSFQVHVCDKEDNLMTFSLNFFPTSWQTGELHNNYQ